MVIIKPYQQDHKSRTAKKQRLGKVLEKGPPKCADKWDGGSWETIPIGTEGSPS